MMQNEVSVQITVDEAQRIIRSQRKEIDILRGRLTRAHICTSYLDSSCVRLNPAQITAAINHLYGLIESDQADNPEDDYFQQYDHEELEKAIASYKELEKHKDFNPHSGIRVSVYSFEFLFIATGYDEQRAREQLNMFSNLRKYLWKEGEKVPPNHFSSSGIWY
jgi:hypothetical protein